MNLYIKSFAYGFMYVFGMVNMPVPKDVHKLIHRNDEKAISGDWLQVGKEVMNAYEATEKPAS